MKKIIVILLVVLTGISIWYFLLKNEDYRVSFEIESPKGAIYEHLLIWNYGEPFSNQVITTISREPNSHLIQEFVSDHDSILNIEWSLENKNDSITKLTGFYTDEKHSLKQRFQLLFGSPNIKPQSIAFSKKLKSYIKRQNESFKLSKIDTATFSEKKFLYKTLKSTPQTKAKIMQVQNGVMMNYIVKNQLTLDNYPFLEVTSWDRTTDSITFNFCYPIKEQHISKKESILYAEKESFKALQILFNGNYNKSHVAWYAYEDYFDNKDGNREVLPIEVYQNDPQQGGDEMQWETRVLVPI